MKTVVSRSTEETVDLGRWYAQSLRPGDVVALIGTLGSGKTQFVTGVCLGLGVTAGVGSPTFTLINEYPAAFGVVAHVDLYRIDRRSELVELGIEEYFNDRCICLIEWAERIEDFLPRSHKVVKMQHRESANERLIEIFEESGVPV